MALPARIAELVQHFTQHIDSFKGSGYNETRARIEFIDPFFNELGWDINNTQGFAEAYKDVIHEDAIKVEGSTKAPDYSFRIGGQRKFFLEAKKPSVNVKDDIAPAYQLRRYAWNAGLPVSILTDFEEFAIYDTTIRPNVKDKASTARLFYCTYEEYEKHWEYIASIFSKDAILKGSFDHFLKDSKRKKGTTAVDKEFLKEMEQWRSDLAKNIALRNTIDIHPLNYVVQATIDRILFLRICEDRNIEEYGRLQKLAAGTHIYKQLTKFFEQADEKYNSGLFHFHKEKDVSSAPDEISLNLKIDDKILKEIITALYYPSPYEFSVISADILGNVYEQFLGKVIRLTSGGQAKVEEKPEVKKAGGVYYTPQYIVKYIVENTVGELLKEKTPMMVAGKVKGHTPLRILDPACGSGSFLIYAYQYLLDWHRDWYEKDIKQKGAAQAKKWGDAVYQGPGDHWYLTTREKKRILVNNIFGVDIDHQAVEVTKLNLLLKVLEGENRETLGTNLKLFQERALPDLAENIKCGNSLIGSDFYSTQLKGQKDLFDADDEEKYKINAFDWETEFPEVFVTGGFNAVIGNPPYGAFTGTSEALYFRAKYKSPANSLDTFLLFVERGHQLIKNEGMLGIIIPSGWVSTPSAKPLRHFFIENFKPRTFVSLPFGVFEAYIDTVIVTAQRVPKPEIEPVDVVKLVVFPPKFKIQSVDDFKPYEKIANYRDWLSSPNIEFLITCSHDETVVLEKIRKQSKTFGDFLLVKRGIEVFQPQSTKTGLVNPKQALVGAFQRYDLGHAERGFVSYEPDVEQSKPFAYFSGSRILLRQVLSRKLRLQAVLTTETFLTNQSVQSLIASANGAGSPSLPFLLGVLNSRLISWYFVRFNSVARRDDFPKIIIQQTRELPLPEFEPIRDNIPYGQIALLVDRMHALNDQIAAKSLTPTQQDQIQRQIDATDREIDNLVYQLYGLTEEEIKIVEGDAPSGAEGAG